MNYELVVYALREQLRKADSDLGLLRTAVERELTDEERSLLPSALMAMSRQELVEQIDAWVNLSEDYKDLIVEFQR